MSSDTSTPPGAPDAPKRKKQDRTTVRVNGVSRYAYKSGIRLRNGRIYQNTEHPAYDVHMEIACLLPCFPGRAMELTIAADLNISVAKVQPLVEELSKRLSVPIRRSLVPPITARFSRQFDVAWTVPTNAWPELRDAAAAYYDEVYAESPSSTSEAVNE